MKLLNPVIGALGIAGTMCFAAENDEIFTGTIWVAGVSQKGGWYDADKSKEDTRTHQMCYAASASNLIAWWQNGTYGQTLTSEAPKDIIAIWGTFLSECRYYQSPGDPLASINWWVNGVYLPKNEAEEERAFFSPEEDPAMITLPEWQGYYAQYGINKAELRDFMDITENFTGSIFGDLLNDGVGVSLQVKSDVGNLAHIITLWGVEYTSSGSLAKLWVTDSDDMLLEHKYGELFSIDVITDSNGRIYFNEDADIGYYKEVLNRFSGIYIERVNVLIPSASAGWQLVPEPATATLTLLALVGLAARRRRAAR